MAREAVIASLKRLFGDRGVDIDALRDDEDLPARLGWDSMDVVDLGMELERLHGVRLSQAVDEIRTIARLCDQLGR